jgi:hypothetical protein
MVYGTVKLIGNVRLAYRTIKERMPLVYDRLADPVRYEAEVTMVEQKWSRGKATARDWLNITFKIADAIDVASESLAALTRLGHEHPDWSPEKVAYEAQRLVLSTHTGSVIENQPDIFKQGELAKTLVAFTGEATAASDYLNYLGLGAFKGKIPKHRFFRQLLFTIVGVGLIMRLADRISRGRERDTNAKKWYNTWWGYISCEAIETVFAPLGRYITNGLRGMTWANAPVALKPFAALQNLAAAAANKDVKGVAEHFAEFISYVTGAPFEGAKEAKRWLFPTVPKSNEPGTLPEYPTFPSFPKMPHP